MALSNAQTPVSQISGSGTTVAKAFGSNVTAGNLIVVCVWSPQSASHAVSTVEDSLGNTYELAIGPITQSSLGYRGYIYYAKNIGGGACTVTVTLRSLARAWNGSATTANRAETSVGSRLSAIAPWSRRMNANKLSIRFNSRLPLSAMA